MMHRNREFNDQLIFAVEQWLAFAVGIVCLSTFMWAAVAGHKAFASQHLAHLGGDVLVAIGWSLTMALGFFGVWLMRLAFYKSNKLETTAR